MQDVHDQFHAVMSRPRLAPGTSDATGVCTLTAQPERVMAGVGGRCLWHLLSKSWFEMFFILLDLQEGTVVRLVHWTPGCIMAHI